MTGAKASQTSGTASGSRVCRSTTSVMRFLPASAIRASHSPESPSKISSSALPQPQHVAEVIGLPGVEIDTRRFASGSRTNRRGRLLGGQAGVAGIVDT